MLTLCLLHARLAIADDDFGWACALEIYKCHVSCHQAVVTVTFVV